MSNRDIRTVVGFLIILLGLASSLWLGWWLGTEGDIIDIIHRVKLGLPGWAWSLLKVSLSAMFGLVYLLFFIALAALVFRGRASGNHTK